MRKKILLLLTLTFIYACEEKAPISFSESSLQFNDNALIEINVPKAQGNDDLSQAINAKIDAHIANALSFSEEDVEGLTLNEAVQQFDTEYKAFKDDFEESKLIWEAVFDGEVTYQSPEVICIAINSFLNTGGAHGNMNISFLNFNPQDGTLLGVDDIIADKSGLTELAKTYFKEEAQLESEEGYGDYFFGEEFHLPANIGFSDDGLILFYNVYEIASYAVGVTEFTIPFEDVEAYLKIH